MQGLQSVEYTITYNVYCTCITFRATSLTRSWLSLCTDMNPLNVSPKNIILERAGALKQSAIYESSSN